MSVIIKNGVSTKLNDYNWVPRVKEDKPELRTQIDGHLFWVKDLLIAAAATDRRRREPSHHQHPALPPARPVASTSSGGCVDTAATTRRRSHPPTTQPPPPHTSLRFNTELDNRRHPSSSTASPPLSMAVSRYDRQKVA
ncbi:envelope glycoprotein [Striga asiatica]|uniref:Envelope glycoprotein n=1 Tax=Striga asiatica TaxID=4170 RepID=A0A5A7PQQ0_STRAF|nr:envelope glycoprotein [Striga asiatica]